MVEPISKIESFEDIKAWQKAKILSLKIYEITDSGALAKDFGLRDQLRRASVSIMSNIAEGFERGGNKEFVQFLSQSKASAAEIQSEVHVGRGVGYIDEETFRELYDTADEVRSLIGGFIRYLKGSDRKGPKFEK